MGKARYIVGTVTIIGLLGFTAYAIKKYKDEQKADEEGMTVAEAMAEVQAHKNKLHEEYAEGTDSNVIHFKSPLDPVASPDSDGEDIEGDEGIAPGAYDNGKKFDIEDEEDDDEYFDEDDEEFDEDEEEIAPQDDDTIPFSEYITEEDKELKYEPSSLDAKAQFINMELAEWARIEDPHKTMLKLFDFEFTPKNDGDWDLKTKIIDYKVQFFGFGSRWTQIITFADVILYFARLANYNVDESVRYWVDYFLDFNELHHTTPSHRIDELLDQLNSHTYFNEKEQTFGLFGLTRNSMDQAIKIANGNIDKSVTYEIEFNEFLKSCL